jgi:hypothetical protein
MVPPGSPAATPASLPIAADDGREFALEVFGPRRHLRHDRDARRRPAQQDRDHHRQLEMGVIPRDRFQAWLTGHPLLQQSIVAALVKMLRSVYERVGMQALPPVKRRVRAALIEIAQSNGASSDSHEFVVPRPTHRELAERVGTTRVVVSRVIKELLEVERWIRMDGHTLRVGQDFGETPRPTPAR